MPTHKSTVTAVFLLFLSPLVLSENTTWPKMTKYTIEKDFKDSKARELLTERASNIRKQGLEQGGDVAYGFQEICSDGRDGAVSYVFGNNNNFSYEFFPSFALEQIQPYSDINNTITYHVKCKFKAKTSNGEIFTIIYEEKVNITPWESKFKQAYGAENLDKAFSAKGVDFGR